MSVTERIIEVVERGRKRDLSDDLLDQTLYAIGCTRVMRIADEIIVYYLDEGEEHFLVIAL